MKNLNISIVYYIIVTFFIHNSDLNAQVAIGTSQLDAGAIFQVESADKGVLIPRINLVSTFDVSTIPNPAEGLMIYNISNVGSGDTSVTPGLYYWSGTEWIRVFTRGFSLQFTQTAQNLVNTLADIPINGLNQDVVAPYSGVYRITVTSYFGASQIGNPGQSDENIAKASVRLELDGIPLSEKIVPTFSKFIDDSATGGNGSINFFALSRQVVITKDVELIAGQSYNFNVIGRLWDWTNVSPVIGGFTYFGLNTTLYERNPGLTDDASRTKLTINLVRQY